MQRVSVAGHEPKPRMLAGSFDATQPFRLSFSQAPLESDTSGVTGAFLGLVKGTFHNQPRPRLEPQGHQVPCFSVQAWQTTPEPGPVLRMRGIHRHKAIVPKPRPHMSMQFILQFGSPAVCQLVRPISLRGSSLI